MNKGLIIALSIVGALVLVAGIIAMQVIGIRNSLVSMDEGIKSSWSEVENQMQRRNDLIPNLVSTVKGYAAHESGVFQAIADARAKMGGARTAEEKMEGSNAMTTALSRLMVVVENYPNLKADAQFNRLSDELAGTENRLAVARKRYNDAIQPYNIKVRSFPDNIVAGMFNMKELPYFKAPEEAKAVPKVDFGK